MPKFFFCRHCGCHRTVPEGTFFCKLHQADQYRKPAMVTKKPLPEKKEENRETACKRGYDRKWRQAREGYLKHHPLCVECAKKGIVTPATVVDHIKPHKGNRELFWDVNNWQSLCKKCHDIKTFTKDRGKYEKRLGISC